MAKVAVGSIPKNISYVFSEEKEVPVGCAWDINWSNSEDEPKTIKKKVFPAYPVDSSDTTALTRATNWVNQRKYDYTTNTYINLPFSIKEEENKPISNIQVLSLEERAQGGRAYKILIDKYYVDLREDVMMDTLLQVGIDPGGILKGEYIWAKMGAQTKLVRIGSELYRLLVEFDSKKDFKSIGKNDLEIGGLYQDKRKNKAIFIGYINTVSFKSENGKESWKDTPKATFNFTQKVIKKSMLFYEFSSYESIDQNINMMNSDKRNYYFKIKRTHNYIEKIKQVDISTDIVQRLKNNYIENAKNKILEYTGHRAPEDGHRQLNANELEDHIVYNSDFINISVYGDPMPKVFDIKKYLIFS